MTTQTEIISEFQKSIDFSKDIPITNWEENSTIEFKKSLQTNSETIGKEYLKTICGFANNLGGVIIFGICPDKKELVGIKPQFENLDNRYVSTTITKALDGSFNYSFFTMRLIGKIIGFLHIAEATIKPVILKVDSSNFVMGEIYFRYPAQTHKIFASDLRKIINEEIANRLRATVGNISKLVEAGDNAAILNTLSGEIEVGNSMTKFIIDESILSKLNLIKEGHFVDNEGSPAYIIKGEIESGNVEFIEKNIPSVINESDILEYFFNTTCEFPETAIERLVYSQSPYNPLHYFIKEAKFTKEQAIGYIENLSKPHVNQSVKDKILERIRSPYPFKINSKVIADIEDIFSGNISEIEILVSQIILKNNLKSSVNVQSQIKRTIFYNSLIRQLTISNEIFQSECKCITEAFSNLKKEHLLMNKEYYLSSLKSLTLPLEKHSTATISLLRKVICFVDEVYYYEL
jgi:hypothetical protein